MKIAATVNIGIQVGFDEWMDKPITKIFHMSNSFETIEKWAQTLDKNNTIWHVKFSKVVE